MVSSCDQWPPVAPRERPQLELTVIGLRSTIAVLYAVGAYLGNFGASGGARFAIVAWILGYHVVLAVYVFRYRLRGRSLRWFEFICPLADLSFITVPWLATGQPDSPFWALYLYALVAFARRYTGIAYLAVSGWTVANVAIARWLLQPTVDPTLVTMVVMTTAMGVLSFTIGKGWRSAEESARRLAETDPLTGIHNRRTFLRDFEALATDGEARFAVIMLDLDDFKLLNDQFGHLYGDAVLVEVAEVLAATVGSTAKVARYGGEEFIIALPGLDTAEAMRVAEAARAAVEGLGVATASLGCAVRRPGESGVGVIQRADERLLAVKRQGKNAVAGPAIMEQAA